MKRNKTIAADGCVKLPPTRSPERANGGALSQVHTGIRD